MGLVGERCGGKKGGELKSGGGVTEGRFIGGEMEVKWRDVYGIEGPELLVCLSFVCGACVALRPFANITLTSSTAIPLSIRQDIVR